MLGDGSELIRVVEKHPFITSNNAGVWRHYAWELFRRGRLNEARDNTERLAQAFPEHRDLNLEIIVAIKSGEWESLAKPLSAFLDNVAKYSGLELIRAAQLAQQSGQGPMMDLIRAAVSKAGSDPHVYLGAYTIIVEDGLEDTVPESTSGFGRHWFYLRRRDPKGRYNASSSKS